MGKLFILSKCLMFVKQNPEKQSSRKSSLLEIFHGVGEIQTKPYTYLSQFSKQNLNHDPSEKKMKS